MKAPVYAALLFGSLLATVAAILTLVPYAGASYDNVLGYKSLCTFAPVATLFCSFIAGTTCIVRASQVKRRAMYGQPVFKPAPVLIVGLLLALALASSIWFGVVDSQYPDGTTGATATETAAN